MRFGTQGPLCAVLGAGGFFGRNLCHGLLTRGARVRACGRGAGLPQAQADGFEWVGADLADPAALRAAVDGADVIFYLLSASVPGSSRSDALEALALDCGPALALLDLAHDRPLGKIIFASSGGTIYGVPQAIPISEAHPTNPISPYGISKLTIEKHLHLAHHVTGLDYQVLRVANPYGPHQGGRWRQGLVGETAKRLLRGEAIHVWGDGAIIRDYIHIEDVIDAFWRSVHYVGSHCVMNVASGIGRSVTEVITDVAAVLGVEANVQYSPARVADVPINVLDCALLRSEMGWAPMVSWPDGLAQTIEWLRKQM